MTFARATFARATVAQSAGVTMVAQSAGATVAQCGGDGGDGGEMEKFLLLPCGFPFLACFWFFRLFLFSLLLLIWKKGK